MAILDRFSKMAHFVPLPKPLSIAEPSVAMGSQGMSSQMEAPNLPPECAGVSAQHWALPRTGRAENLVWQPRTFRYRWTKGSWHRGMSVHLRLCRCSIQGGPP